MRRLLYLIFCFIPTISGQIKTCKTKSESDNPQPNIDCVFPFTYQGIEFDGCTNITDKTGDYWCATSVGPDGEYIPNSKMWGYCAPGCPIHDSFFGVPIDEEELIDVRSTNTLPMSIRQCKVHQECIPFSKCDFFTNSKNSLDTYPKYSKEYKTLFKSVKDKVCNYRYKGICCSVNDDSVPSCPLNQCVEGSQCEYVQNLYKIVFDMNDPKRSHVISELKSLICDSKNKKFCCPEVSKTDTTNNKNTKSTNTKQIQNDQPKVLDPSYLPGNGECGFNPHQSPSRVVGGKATKPGDFPFTALIGYPRKTKCFDQVGVKHIADVTNWGCGGTLINHWYVVTAAHCQGKSPTSSISVVRLGEWEVDEPVCSVQQNSCVCPLPQRGDCTGQYCLPGVQDFIISSGNVIVHKDYKKTARNVINDIALIRLPRPVELNPGVQIACLPIDPIETAQQLNLYNLDEDFVGTWPRVVGWGYSEYNPYISGPQGDIAIKRVAEAKQQYVELPVVSTQDCITKFWRGVDIQPSQLCVGGVKGKDSCKGDSGGPLYLTYVNRNNKKSVPGPNTPWFLMGLVSFGSSSCGSKPGFYTRLESFIPWIREQIVKNA